VAQLVEHRVDHVLLLGLGQLLAPGDVALGVGDCADIFHGTSVEFGAVELVQFGEGVSLGVVVLVKGYTFESGVELLLDKRLKVLDHALSAEDPERNLRVLVVLPHVEGSHVKRVEVGREERGLFESYHLNLSLILKIVVNLISNSKLLHKLNGGMLSYPVARPVMGARDDVLLCLGKDHQIKGRL
jgi:hypothetical protein